MDWGRETCGRLATAESREWLCTNGLGGFASGTVAGTLTRRYHGLLIAALKPPLGRTLLVSKLDDTVEYDSRQWSLFANRWGDGSVGPHGYHEIEGFHLDGAAPVWTFACGDALIEKRIWMEQDANTTYVQYRAVRAGAPLTLELKAFVNYRDYHSATRGGGWSMRVEPVPSGLRVTAFEGAQPVVLLGAGAEVSPTHVWHHDFHLSQEAERGLDAAEDHLQVGVFRATLAPGAAFTVAFSTDAAPDLDGDRAWERRRQHDEQILASWRQAEPAAAAAPAWIAQLVLAADQFVVRRPIETDPDAMSLIAGYHWFGDWGRDTMIALPGLTIATGRHDVARRILITFAGFVDRGMLPNWFPDRGEEPEYNTVDATLWYFQAVRAYLAATGDDALLKDLFPVLGEIIRWHQEGTRYGIVVDPTDGLLRAGEPGVQLTWMDARVDGREVTPRAGKPVEINALWYNALLAMALFARRLGQPADPWEAMAARVRAGFERFWNPAAGYCYDVIDGPRDHGDGPGGRGGGSEGTDDALRPNQIFAVSLPESPLPPERQRGVVDACARHLLTSYGLRSLAPDHPLYQGQCTGAPSRRDGAYHQGTVWAWLAGPFALAHFRAYSDRAAARAFLAPLAHHLGDYGVGSIAEIFDGDPPHTPRGCIAQAWSVGETLRAWLELAPEGEPRRRRLRS